MCNTMGITALGFYELIYSVTYKSFFSLYILLSVSISVTHINFSL